MVRHSDTVKGNITQPIRLHKQQTHPCTTSYIAEYPTQTNRSQYITCLHALGTPVTRTTHTTTHTHRGQRLDQALDGNRDALVVLAQPLAGAAAVTHLCQYLAAEAWCRGGSMCDHNKQALGIR